MRTFIWQNELSGYMAFGTNVVCFHPVVVIILDLKQLLDTN